MLGKVVRPLRSVDPTQTEYQGLIDVTDEGGWCLVSSHRLAGRAWERTNYCSPIFV